VPGSSASGSGDEGSFVIRACGRFLRAPAVRPGKRGCGGGP
jgi:hypothetical protein